MTEELANELLLASSEAAVGGRSWLAEMAGRLGTAYGRLRHEDREPTGIQAARFGVALRDENLRDAMWKITDESPEQVGLWLSLSRRLPPPYNAVPEFLVAWSQWRRGADELAKAAVERATWADPALKETALGWLQRALEEGIKGADLPPLQDAPLGLH